MTDVYATPTLAIAVEDSGAGAPLVLLHGWPDDVRTWDGVAPVLREAGWRTIVPYLRGFGPTRFQPGAPRSGDLEALGRDVLDLLDAMGIGKAVLVGHDWGARAAYVAAHAAPERVEACVAVSTGWPTNAIAAPSYDLLQRYWYHFLFATPLGARALHDDRRALTRYIWDIWAARPLAEDAFAATAPSFDNEAWPEVTQKSYTVRWGNAEPDPAYEPLRAAARADPTLRVPTLVIHGTADPVSPPALSEGTGAHVKARFERVLLDGLGHFPQREDPADVAAAIVGFVGRRG